MIRQNFSIGGLNVVTIDTDKFKTTDILINFRNYMDERTVTKRALIPSVLRAGSLNFPSKKTISRELERLYGASFGSSVNKQGRQQILSFRLSIVNDAYLRHEEYLLDDAFKLIHDILFNPLLEEDVFVDKVVNTEKRLLEDSFDALYDNKIRYAYDRMLSHMYSGETYRLRSIGDKADLASITATNLYETYQSMLNEDAVDVFVIGDIDNERIKGLVETYIKIPETRHHFDVLDLEEKKIEKVNEVFEYQDINQAKLNLGLRTYTRGMDEDYDALVVLNGILGGYPHSLLFKQVREKNSLCYYISSTIDRAKGGMVIYAGIEHSDYQKALDLTLEQIEVIKKGDFTEEILTNTKNHLINDLLELNDNPSAILATDFASLLYGEAYDVEKRRKSIQAVTKEDVVKVADKLTLDTIYYLTKEGGAQGE